jgi:hypothetical protein
MKKYRNFILISFISVSLLYLPACTFGVDIADNCEKNQRKVVAVLPFVDDDYNCSNNVENALLGKCYNIYDGKTLANECSFALNKGFEDISMEELTAFAAKNGIDMLVYGNVSIEWAEGPRSIIRPTGNQSSSSEVNKVIEGNYAVINCFLLNTSTKEETKMYDNFRLKRVQLGSPDVIWSMPTF